MRGISHNFPGILTYWMFLKNCWNSTPMYSYISSLGDKAKICVEVSCSQDFRVLHIPQTFPKYLPHFPQLSPRSVPSPNVPNFVNQIVQILVMKKNRLKSVVTHFSLFLCSAEVNPCDLVVLAGFCIVELRLQCTALYCTAMQ